MPFYNFEQSYIYLIRLPQQNNTYHAQYTPHNPQPLTSILVQPLPQRIRIRIFLAWAHPIEQHRWFARRLIEIDLWPFSIGEAIDRSIGQRHVWVSGDITAVAPLQTVFGITVVRVPPIVATMGQQVKPVLVLPSKRVFVHDFENRLLKHFGVRTTPMRCCRDTDRFGQIQRLLQHSGAVVVVVPVFRCSSVIQQRGAVVQNDRGGVGHHVIPLVDLTPCYQRPLWRGPWPVQRRGPRHHDSSVQQFTLGGGQRTAIARRTGARVCATDHEQQVTPVAGVFDQAWVVVKGVENGLFERVGPVQRGGGGVGDLGIGDPTGEGALAGHLGHKHVVQIVFLGIQHVGAPRCTMVLWAVGTVDGLCRGEGKKVEGGAGGAFPSRVAGASGGEAVAVEGAVVGGGAGSGGGGQEEEGEE